MQNADSENEIRRRSTGVLACALLALVGLAGLSGPAQAATPRSELLRLVPEDVGFCLVLEDLRGHGTALLNSPFFKQFFGSSLASKVVQAEEKQKLDFVDKFMQQTLHVTATQLRDEILGDALVLAYRPGPTERPEQEVGLLLVRARNAKLLADLVDRFNDLQKAGGDLAEVEERTYHAAKYYRRDEKKAPTYYYLRGPVLAFTNQESVLQQVLDLDLKTPAGEDSPVARQFQLLGVDKPLAALWVNPRAFDESLRQKAETASADQAPALKTLLLYWKAIEGICLSVTLEEDFGLSLAVRARTDQLPAPARNFLASAARRTDLWDQVPPNAMLAVAGRTDVSALIEILGSFMTEEARKSVHKGVEGGLGAIFGEGILQAILPQLGPDWVGYIVAPPDTDKNWFPQSLAGLRLRPGPGEVPTELTVWNAVNALSALAVLNLNGGQPGAFVLHSVLQDQVEVKYLTNEEKFPPGLQPAAALKEGHFLMASSPAAIRAFHAPAQRPDTGLQSNIPLMRVSIREISRFVKERRQDITAFLVKKHHSEPNSVNQGLDGFLAGLDLFDAIELTQRGDPGRVILSLRIRTSQPLK